MRISEDKVDVLSEQIIEMLTERADVRPKTEAGRMRVVVRQAMLDELLVEDRLEEEVREILKQYDYEIRRGRMSYNTLFNRVKAKLVRERNLVL
ncbi:MAG: DUF507 family protein [Chloroflexia bacterium]|nr:DUF507 family protein [Chloroflexia bacterium]